MPAAKRARKAAPSKGAAARAEKTDTPKTITFRGATLALPRVLPGTLYFDLADLAENESNPSTQVRVLTSMIGADQVERVRAKILEDQVPLSEMDAVIYELFDAAMSAYGMTTGESSASPQS